MEGFRKLVKSYEIGCRQVVRAQHKPWQERERELSELDKYFEELHITLIKIERLSGYYGEDTPA